MSDAVTVAALVVDELVRCGMTDAVLAPGSRNAPLAYALAAADETEAVRLHVRIDERSAAFLALGLAKRSGRPVAVCCTSGTATANFHSAVLEAAESGIPLVVLTADRPPELRGVRANQTVDQARLYGHAVRTFIELGDVPPDRLGSYVRSTTDRLVAAALGALGADAGPVQLNLPLREPLTPSPDQPQPPPGRPHGRPWTSFPARLPAEDPVDAPVERTLVVVGDATPAIGRRARGWAEAYGWPLVAEPSSCARAGPLAVPAAPLLLAVPGLVDALRPDRVLVVGRPTLTRSVASLLRRTDLDVEIRTTTPHWPDPSRQAERVAVGLPEPPTRRREPSAWARRWLAAGAAAAEARDALLDEGGALTGPLVAREVARAAAGGMLVVGSSLPVRDLDATVDDLCDRTVLANRGVAGIDGTVSTAIGVALASDARPAFALLGDLTFLHDANGLILGPGEPRPGLCLVVVDNNGGGIFATLEQGADATPEPGAAESGNQSRGTGVFERVFGTPHGVDLQALCAATGTAYQRAESTGELHSALKDAASEEPPRLRVLHVPISRHSLLDEGSRLRAAVAAAVTPLLT